MKYDLKNGKYAQFYKDATMLRTYLNDHALLNTNYRFWTSQFSISTDIVPTDKKGVAAFTSQVKVKGMTPMADMRAPLAHGKALDKAGISFYTGTIPDFISPATYENAFERAYDDATFDAYGRDKELVKEWTENVQGQIDSLNQTLSNMSAQLLSTGVINYKYGRGIKNYVQEVPIPKENIVKGGTEVWTSPSCKLLDQMAKIENDFRMRTGFEGAMKWQIPLKMFREAFLTNAQVIEWVKYSKQIAGIVMPEIKTVLEEDVMAALAKYNRISPIEVVTEKQKDWSGEVSGWKEGIAVLRPSGFAGEVKRTDILDRKMHEAYGAKSVTKVFSPVGESGIFTLCNITRDNGDYKEWATEIYFSGVPVLTEFPYHVIVDTAQAGDGVATITID